MMLMPQRLPPMMMKTIIVLRLSDWRDRDHQVHIGQAADSQPMAIICMIYDT